MRPLPRAGSLSDPGYHPARGTQSATYQPRPVHGLFGLRGSLSFRRRETVELTKKAAVFVFLMAVYYLCVQLVFIMCPIIVEEVSCTPARGSALGVSRRLITNAV